MEEGQPPQAGTLSEDVAPSRRHGRRSVTLAADRARDPQFGTADFPFLISVDNGNRRFARHFELSPEQAA
jgi:hypothetical protein